MSPEFVRVVTELFPVMTSTEIEQRYGFNRSHVLTYASRAGVRSSAEKLERIRRMASERAWGFLSKGREKSADSRKRTVRLERWRMLSGMRRKTRLRLTLVPKRIRDAKKYLVHHYDYFADADDEYLLYYHAGAHRTKKEDFYTQAHHLRFMEWRDAEEEPEDDDADEYDTPEE